MAGTTLGWVLVPLLAALWLAAATAATLIGIRRIGAARRAQTEAGALAGLIAAAPSVPFLVQADGQVEADPRVGEWLGLSRTPRTLRELLDGGLPTETADRLQTAFAAALTTGSSFAETIEIVPSGRVLSITGGPYVAPELPTRVVLAWLHDVTERQQAIVRLAADGERLGRSLDGLSKLIEAAPLPMWYRGTDLKLALVNGAYVRAVEAKDAADVVARGLELIETNAEESAAAREARTAQLVATRNAPAIVAGQRRMMRVVDVPIGEAGIAGYAMDVQELEDARADLHRFEAAQRDMLDRLSAGVAQFAADQGLVFYNRPFLRMFALDPDWLADRPAFDRVLERLREAGRAPESRDFPGWKSERRRWFFATAPVEESWALPGGLHLRVVAQPLPDGGLLLIFEDRTEHLQLASARDTLLRVRTATFDNLFEAVGVFAADGRLHLWNNRFREVWELPEAELSRHPRVDALVQTIAPRLSDPSRAGAIRELVRSATLERHQRQGRMALKDGRQFEFAAVPLPDGNALFTLLDITASHGIEEALRERNDALEEANSLKNAFVATMSYELRVPLTSIAGFAEMLAAGYAGELPEAAQGYTEAILSAVQRLGSLIGDALDLSQGEIGDLPMATESIEVATLVREAAEIAAEGAKSRNLVLALDIDAHSGTVAGDRRRLRQSLDHLLRNAMTYTPAGGRVLVRSRAVGDVAEITVADNGDGIPPAKRERIFDRLSQVRGHAEEDLVSDGARQRTGIGLPFARHFVEAHGGEFLLQSEPDRGTRVTLRLPLREAAVSG